MLNRLKNVLKDFDRLIFVKKKVPKKLKTVSLLTKQNELSAKSIVKLFKVFKLILFCLKKVEKKLKRVLLLTKRNKLPAQLIANPFKFEFS